MRQVYLSHILDNSTPVYGGRDGFLSNAVSQIGKDGTSNSSSWIFSSNHIGTHVDAPRHFAMNGLTVDQQVPDFWQCQKPVVLNVAVNANELITPEMISPFEDIVGDSDAIIFRTGFEKYRALQMYWENNPGLGFGLADYLREIAPNIKLVGMDFISVSRWQNREMGRQVHREFLSPGRGQPIWIIEDMSLQILERAALRHMMVVPLRVKNADGGPCTIIGVLDES